MHGVVEEYELPLHLVGDFREAFFVVYHDNRCGNALGRRATSDCLADMRVLQVCDDVQCVGFAE